MDGEKVHIWYLLDLIVLDSQWNEEFIDFITITCFFFFCVYVYTNSGRRIAQILNIKGDF